MRRRAQAPGRCVFCRRRAWESRRRAGGLHGNRDLAVPLRCCDGAVLNVHAVHETLLPPRKAQKPSGLMQCPIARSTR